MKKISVIIATYNSSKTIERLLVSIFNQTGYLTDFGIEVLLVDDCSTDNTLVLVEQFNVIIFSTGKNTGGPNKSRNIGLENSTGDYICIADHDDEWIKDRLISQISFLKDVPIVTSNFTLIDFKSDTKRHIGNSSPNGHITFDKNETFKARLQKSKKGQSIYLGSILFDRRLKVHLFEEHFGMVDYDYQLRLFQDNASIEVTKSLYYRHVDDNNLSLDHSYRMKDFYYSLFFIEQYRKDYHHEHKLATRRIHGTRARYHYIIGDMKLARQYFKRSSFNFKTVLFYLTSFYGSKYVKNKYNIFG